MGTIFNKSITNHSIFLFLLSYVAVLLFPFCSVPPAVAQKPYSSEKKNLDIIAVIPENFPPQYSVDKDGHPTGFAIDVMEEVAQLAGLNVSYRIEKNFNIVAKSLREGKADLIPNAGITPERQKHNDFTIPVETFSVVIFTRSSTPEYDNLEELNGKVVAVIKSNIGEKILRKTPKIIPEVYDHVEIALFDLLAGKVDALIYPKPVVLELARRIRIEDKIKITGEPLIEIKRALRVRKGDPLLAILNPKVEQFVHSKKYQEIYEKWYGKPQPFWTVRKVLTSSVTLITLLLVSFLLYRYLLLRKINRRQTEVIHEKTAELQELVAKLQRENEEKQSIENSLKEAQRIGKIGSWDFDVSANTLYWSDEIYTIFEIDQHSFTPSYDSFFQAVHPQDRELVDNAYKTSIEKRLPYSIEHRLLMPDGRVKFVKEQCETRYDADGKATRSVGTIQDITASKKLEEELAHANKMEALGTLAGGIAHDFNNILTAIIGYAEFLKEDISLSGSTTAKNDINQIKIAGNRAKELVKQILTFSRQGKETCGKIDPSIIIREALKLMRSSLPTTINISEKIPKHCGTIIANPTNIHQVLINLCTNSLHAMEGEKGELTVELSRILLNKNDERLDSGSPAGPYIKLSVSDTGSGIDPDVLDRIFDPFFTTKDVGKGTGMGLSQVHGIVQGCGGFIHVDTTPGQGCSFHLYFPAVEKTSTEDSKTADTTPLPTGKESILVIDDEEPIATMLKTVLERQGYRVKTFTNSQAALEAVKREADKYELVITDQTMPYLPGIELAQEILALRPDIPIILCTGFSSVVSKQEAITVGIRKFLMKPIDRKELITAVRSLLDQ